MTHTSEFARGQIVGQTDWVLFVDLEWDLIESRDERVFEPIDEYLGHEYEQTVGK